jgi:hypothetical protein
VNTRARERRFVHLAFVIVPRRSDIIGLNIDHNHARPARVVHNDIANAGRRFSSIVEVFGGRNQYDIMRTE